MLAEARTRIVPCTPEEARAGPGPVLVADGLAGRRVCLVCTQGRSSSLAAALLVELGVDAGDLIGGYEAW